MFSNGHSNFFKWSEDLHIKSSWDLNKMSKEDILKIFIEDHSRIFKKSRLDLRKIAAAIS